MKDKQQKKKYLLCVCKENNSPLSLMFRKVYEQLPDIKAEKAAYVRIIDESGEDYIYPAKYFISVVVQQAN